MSRLREAIGPGPLLPLVVLVGLNTVDELDRAAFAILAPEIRDEFGLGFTGLLALIALVFAAALALQIPIAGLADRMDRFRLAIAGAVVWAVFSFLTGVAGSIVFLGFMRSGSAIGKAVVDPTHNSLISDLYPPDRRPAVFAVHRAGNAIGSILGPLAAGFLAYAFGWRVPFLVFAVPTMVFVFLGLRLHDPGRGHFERELGGADAATAARAETPASLTEGWRLCWKVETLRRLFVALPFLATSLIGFSTLAALLYQEAFDLDERARGIVAASVEPAQLVGLVIGGTIGLRFLQRDPGSVLRLAGWMSALAGVFALGFALAPPLWLAIIFNALIVMTLAIIGPSLLTALSLAIPPRARSLGFSIGSLWILPGLVLLPFIGWVADRWGVRQGMVLMVPVFFIGAAVVHTAGALMGRDIEQVRAGAAARAEALIAREEGDAALLVVRDLHVAYGTGASANHVVLGANLDIAEGEIVALLGTNGAGKSTLLRAISGLTEAHRGAVIFDGRDITHAPPEEIARLGIVQLPGGRGVFGSLTVAENLKAAEWLHPGRGSGGGAGADALERFPALRSRLGEPAANLSGGQQQMLALAMALQSEPRLLLLDELSLGLAPTVVAELLPVLREVAASGVAVVVVEQSVNVALTIAERAYFLERGEIRFDGPTAELLDHPELLRSVFLGGAGVAGSSSASAEPTRVEDRTVLEVSGVSRSFGGVEAVAGVSFTIEAGTITGVIGANGAGKTTLFDLVSGLVPMSAGRVVLDGRDITSLAADARARAGLGRSFQDARLFPSLTVEETIAVALERFISSRDPVSAALRMPWSYDAEHQVTRRVGELIELMGLGQLRNHLIRELSTGSRRIVDLACVVAHRPVVLLLDEPSSGIAQRETEALAPVLRRLRDEMGTTLLVIEHDMGLLSAIADRLIALDQGQLIADGTPDEVLNDSRVIASYLGTEMIMRSGGTQDATSTRVE